MKEDGLLRTLATFFHKQPFLFYVKGFPMGIGIKVYNKHTGEIYLLNKELDLSNVVMEEYDGRLTEAEIPPRVIRIYSAISKASLKEGVYFDWETPVDFFEDMRTGYRSNLFIDRIVPSEGYVQGNCVWKTKTQQQENMLVPYNGASVAISEASRYSGIPVDTLRKRVMRGLDEAGIWKMGRDHIENILPGNMVPFETGSKDIWGVMCQTCTYWAHHSTKEALDRSIKCSCVKGDH